MDRVDNWLDMTGEKLSKRTFNIPTTIVVAVLFLIFGISMCFIFPLQIEVSDKDIVDGRSFPYLLMIIMILSCSILIIGELRKIILKKPLEIKEINLLVEVKAIVIFAILVLFFIVARYISFLAGASVCVVCMLMFFRCKKKSYYIITLALATIIWGIFKYGLGIRF